MRKKRAVHVGTIQPSGTEGHLVHNVDTGETETICTAMLVGKRKAVPDYKPLPYATNPPDIMSVNVVASPMSQLLPRPDPTHLPPANLLGGKRPAIPDYNPLPYSTTANIPEDKVLPLDANIPEDKVLALDDMAAVDEPATFEHEAPVDELLVAAGRIVNERTSRQHELPSYRDGAGELRQLDWSTLNMKNIAQVSYSGITRVFSYPTARAYNMVAGQEFKHFRGSRDLFEFAYTVNIESQNLFDEARNAVNSTRARTSSIPIERCFRNSDFAYTNIQGGFFCECLLPPELKFHEADKCMLRDEIALRCIGKRVPQEGGFIWIFEHSLLAQRYLLLSIILCTASQQYYFLLHKKARRRFLRRLREANQMKASSRNEFRDDKSGHRDETFVVAFGLNDTVQEMPFFYLVGHRNRDNNENSSIPRIANDFTIAVPDLQFYRRHYSPGSKKPTKKDVKGDAVYVCPIHSDIVTVVTHTHLVPPANNPATEHHIAVPAVTNNPAPDPPVSVTAPTAKTAEVANNLIRGLL